MTLYAAYRINKDNGQGNRLADPTGTPGTLISSYPMSFQSPEARLAIKINKRLDWNLGYQYYNYNESALVGPRPQNYHAHLPYTSLRVYFGRQGIAAKNFRRLVLKKSSPVPRLRVGRSLSYLNERFRPSMFKDESAKKPHRFMTVAMSGDWLCSIFVAASDLDCRRLQWRG